MNKRFVFGAICIIMMLALVGCGTNSNDEVAQTI